jgi:hypothetical protein
MVARPISKHNYRLIPEVMNINNFRYDISVQKKITVRGEYGDETATYTTVYNLKADVIDNGGTLGMNNKEVFPNKNMTFECYYRPISEDMIILFEGKKYRILHIGVIGFKTGLTIQTELINE